MLLTLPTLSQKMKTLVITTTTTGLHHHHHSPPPPPTSSPFTPISSLSKSPSPKPHLILTKTPSKNPNLEDLVGSSSFGCRDLDLNVVKVGALKGLREGRVKGVIELLRSVEKLGVCVLGLFDGSDMELVARESHRVVNDGNVEEVVELMEALAGLQFSIRDLVEPNDIIRICSNKRRPDMAIRYACLLPYADILFCTIIREFGKRADLGSALKVFEASKHKLSGHNMYAYRTVIDVCGLCGDCFKSRSIYEDLLAENVKPNIYVFNSLMNVNAHDLGYTMEVYKQMQNVGVKPDMTSYNILLKACCLAGRVDFAQEIYKEVQFLESLGELKMDVFTYSTIIKVLADAKLWQMALKIKEDMLSAGVTPNTVTWSSLISACANAGLVDQATHLFEEMLMAGCKPNAWCFNTLLHACVEAFQYDRAFRLFHNWKSTGSQKTSSENPKINKEISGVENTEKNYDSSTMLRNMNLAKSVPFRPTTTTYNILLKACGTDYYRAKVLMDEIKIFGHSPNHISWSILMDICGAAGNIEGALQILKSMRETGNRPDVVAYTIAIKVCVETKNLKIAFSLFAEMKRYRIKPNLVTYNTILKARTRYGSLQEVRQCLVVYQDMRKAGYKPNDYYLKQLIEEWCEGVIQNNQGYQINYRNASEIEGPRTLLLERVALQLQKSTAESLAVDLQGLTKIEARIVVLAVLRMLKENHSLGRPVKDDLTIVLGVRKLETKSVVKEAITNVLSNELGLEFISDKPDITVDTSIDRGIPIGSDSNSTKSEEKENLAVGHGSTTRRPAVLQRLLVTRKSLLLWLERKSAAATKS